MRVMLRASAFVALALAGLLLSACGDKEPEQRKAFIEFLQTRILDKPGVHVPSLSDNQKEAFGPYAKDYAVITDFDSDMDASVVGKMQSVMAKGAIKSLSDLVTRHADIESVRATMNNMVVALGTAEAKADKVKAQLQQPADLKAVYDKTYDRVVTAPATTLKEIFPVVDAQFAAALNFGSYLIARQNQVKLNGVMIEASDPKLRAEIGTKLQEFNVQGQAVLAAQKKLLSVLRGTAQ